jgi:hypothetical protein
MAASIHHAGGFVRSAIRSFALALAFALGASAAVAQQPVFKSTMPDGKVVYGEKPVTGAAKVEKMELPPQKTGVTGVTPEEKARAEQQARQRAQASAAAASSQRAIDDARKALEQAEAARAAGKEPLASERIGIAGGGSRLTEAYFERQKGLDAAVEEARKRLAQMQSGR